MDAQECNSSSNVPSQETVGSTTGRKRKQVNETNNVAATSGKKTVRKKTRCLHLTQDGAPKLPLEFNSLGQPYGANTKDLNNYLAMCVRNEPTAPISLLYWENVDDDTKGKLYLRVTERFSFEETPMIKNWIFRKMCKKFGDWKHTLKQHFDKYETDAERLKNVPDGVSVDQWKVLITHFNDPSVKDVSDQNKRNRSKQILNHRTGSKSYAQIRAEEAAKDPEHRSPTQWKMFCISQRKKDGTVGSSYAQEIMDKFDNEMSSQMEGSESVNEDDVYHKVVGPERHGRVRTYGLGPTPSSLFGSTPGRIELLTRLEESDKRNEAISAQFQELSKVVDDLKKNGEEERKKLQEERRKLEEGLNKVDEERRRMEEDRRIMQENFERLMEEERKRNAEFMSTMMSRMASKSGPSKRSDRFTMSK